MRDDVVSQSDAQPISLSVCLSLCCRLFSASSCVGSKTQYSKFPFLKELGLQEENQGVYSGNTCRNLGLCGVRV